MRGRFRDLGIRNLQSLLEGRQNIHVLAWSSDGMRLAEIICSSREYNKIKTSRGFKEIDHYVVTKDDSPDRFYPYIRDVIDEFSLKRYGSDCGVFGTYGELGYGYYFYSTYAGRLPRNYAGNKIQGLSNEQVRLGNTRGLNILDGILGNLKK